MPLIEYKDRHMLPDEEAVCILDGITYTGGGTIASALAPHYGDQERLWINVFVLGCLYGLSNQQLDTMRFIYEHGARGVHNLLPERKKAFYFTLLRHPLKQQMSMCKGRFHYAGGSYKNSECMNNTVEWCLYDSHSNYMVDWLGNGDLGRAEETLFERYAFFGITEFFTESLHGLSEILPWLKGQTIHNIGMSKKDDITISKSTEDYFMEKNAKDIELYDKAVKEFRKRYSAEKYDVEVKTGENSYKSIDRYISSIQSIDSTLDRAENLSPYLMYVKYASISANDPEAQQWETFYNNLRQYNMPQNAIYEFFCCIRLRKRDEMNMRGNDIFDMIESMDSENRVTALVAVRLDMLKQFLNAWHAFGKGAFSERCRSWLSSLRVVPEWHSVAVSIEAILLEKYGELDAALVCAKSAVESDPDNLEFHEVLCRLLLATGAEVEAETEARNKLSNNPDSEWALRQLVRVLLDKGDSQQVKEPLKKALRKNPCWKDGQTALLDLLFNEGLFAEAEAAARDFLTYLPGSWADLNIFLSRVLEARGDIDGAMSEIRAAVNKEPGTVAFRESLTAFLIRHDRIADAEKEARESIEAFPDQGWPFLQLSQICEARGDSAGGLEYARKGYVLQPEKRALAANLARLLRLSNKQDEFEALCRKAIDRDPNQGWVWRGGGRGGGARGGPCA